MDKDMLLEMIKSQEQVVQNAKEQLQKLYTLAAQMGINVENNNFSSFPISSVKMEIEAKRKELIDRVEKIRQEAMTQAQQAMSAAQSGMSSMNIPTSYNKNIHGSPAKEDFIKIFEAQKRENEGKEK